MLVENLLPDPGELRLEEIFLESRALTLVVSAKQISPPCPSCGTKSSRVDSRYQRKLADLPCLDLAVRIIWRVRRFFCDHPECARVTFAEQIQAVAARYARKTCRLTQQHTGIAFAVGGEPGARLASFLETPTSPDTMLRLIRNTPEEQAETPQVLGVDDWAICKGRIYGTILINLETHRPVDLLPERSAKALADWLKAHPGVKIISRDRSSEYAKGAAEGAPDATQVADRWPLLKNLREALELFLDQNRACLMAAAQAGVESANMSEPEVSYDLVSVEAGKPSIPIETTTQLPKMEQVRRMRREKRLERYQKVMELHQQGTGIREIARQMGIGRDTVRRYIRTGAFPEIAQRRKMPTKISPFCPYLEDRWKAGCHNRLQLWREIREQGFNGSHLLVYLWAEQKGLIKASKPTAQKKHRQKNRKKQVSPWAASRAVWLLLKDQVELKADEKLALESMKQVHPKISLAITLAHEFRSMIREREAEKLSGWIEKALDSGITALHSFVKGLQDDLEAVEAGLSLPWSNGVTEGQVNRLKLVKRQMYGRAKFDLLRRRFLGMPAGP